MTTEAGSHQTTAGARRAFPRMEDGALAGRVGQGDEAAFEELYDRHHRGVLALSRHLLGSLEEAEDALQHTFGVAFRELTDGRRPEHPRPWLYRIARNRCLSLLRARREFPTDAPGSSTAGLSEQVESRADLRALLGDISRLPEQQRAALVLSELDELGHADVARVLGCERDKVRALVFQARSKLGRWREAREQACVEMRARMAVASGAELRGGSIRHHIQVCEECAHFHGRLVAQRRSLALVLPVVPALGLKSSVLESAFAASGAGPALQAAAPAHDGAGGGWLGGSAGKLAKTGAALLVAGGVAVGVLSGLSGLLSSGDQRPTPPPPVAGADGTQGSSPGAGAPGMRAGRDPSRRPAGRRRGAAADPSGSAKAGADTRAGSARAQRSSPSVPVSAPEPAPTAAPPGPAPSSGNTPAPAAGPAPGGEFAPGNAPPPGGAPAPGPGDPPARGNTPPPRRDRDEPLLELRARAEVEAQVPEVPDPPAPLTDALPPAPSPPPGVPVPQPGLP